MHAPKFPPVNMFMLRMDARGVLWKAKYSHWSVVSCCLLGFCSWGRCGSPQLFVWNRVRIRKHLHCHLWVYATSFLLSSHDIYITFFPTHNLLYCLSSNLRSRQWWKHWLELQERNQILLCLRAAWHRSLWLPSPSQSDHSNGLRDLAGSEAHHGICAWPYLLDR